jgi:DNA-binding MarR family transcriptional regulator
VSTRTGGPAAPDIPDIDVARLRVAILRLSRRLRKHDVASLTPTQVSALATVARDGPLRLGDLAAAERIAPSTLTRLVSALEERGFLERSAVAGDARAWQVALTDNGLAVLARIREETTSLLTANLRMLPPDQLAALATALPALEHLASASPA